MKKIIQLLIFLNFFMLSIVNAEMSESFEKMISIMNMPLKNSQGYIINEEIYNKYSMFVYGGPTDVKANQRWKDVANGKWINEKTLNKGEYRILGYSANGNVVNNELFPDDYVSGKSPEEWNYIIIDDAQSSWNITESYQSKEQLNYMKNQNLSRNGITYNLTANSIGLNKARLEAYATWKTSGSVFTLKRDGAGNIWEATFKIPPMAADAKLEAFLNFPSGEKYIFKDRQDEMVIDFSYGTEVTNLSEFARAEDIKLLSTEIEIENNTYYKLNGEKVTSLNGDGQFVIKKSDYPNAKKITVIVKNISILETCFQYEVPMVSIIETPITIYFNEDALNEEKEQFIRVRDVNKTKETDTPKPIITSIKLYRKSINGQDKKALLYSAKKTGMRFISAGQVLVIEANVINNPTSVSFAIEGDSKIQTADSLTKRFVVDEPNQRKEKSIYSTYRELQESYDLPRLLDYENGVYCIEYVIPYGTKQSIHSWNTLRELTGNAINIDKNRLFSRITEPYIIKIKAKNDGGTTTRSVELDVFERWDTIYNRNLTEYIN